MKKLLIIIASIFIAGFLALFLTLFGIPRHVDSRFATSASLRYKYDYKTLHTTITDANDVRTLKEMLTGWSCKDGPSCGFGLDVSITLTDGSKSITFCPACDGDGTFQIGDSDRYIEVSDKQRKMFKMIVKKYGMTFPCE